MTFRILLTGGGSGGHVYPLIAVAEHLKILTAKRGVFLEIHYLGPFSKANSFFFTDPEIKIHHLTAAKIRRYFSLANLLDIPKFFWSVIEAWFKVFWLMPDIIFSKGGPGALAVVFAGWFYRIPIVIHESDSVPGITNIVSSRFAKRIAVAFERAKNYFDPKKTAWIGNPVRKELLESRLTEEAAKEYLGFNQKDPLVLILGGSQGAQKLNEFILTNLENLIQETQILHQTGPENILEVEKLSRAALVDIPVKTKIQYRYQAVPYLEIDTLKQALSAADLIISRAGSGTINEISAFSKPAILVPLPESAGSHQRINAYEFAKGGGGVVIEEKNLSSAIFMKQFEEILTAPEELKRMGLASSHFFKSHAALTLANEILRFASLQ